MKRNTVTLVVGGLLLLIFVALLFTFQVRQTEVAVVTTFDKPTAFHDGSKEPGLKWQLPRPIQKVFKFDRRIQNFEDTFETALTQDGYNLLISVYAGWTITNPTNFFASFPSGTVGEAQPRIEDLIRNAKQAEVGQHPFSHFVSTDEKQLRFAEIEKAMLDAVRPAAEKNYGIRVEFLGVKKLGLPESVTAKVFERMQAERDRMSGELRARGEAEATKIKSDANLERDKILAEADAKATEIRGQAEAEAAKHFAVFEKNPGLAINLRKMAAIEEILKQRATLILDERTVPFDLLASPAGPVTTPKR
jgi:membrane protease subunit HflC